MSLQANALTTAAHARLYVKRNISADMDAELADLLINAYSDAIHDYCERQFKPTETAVAHVLDYGGTGILSLAPYELSAVTSVTVGGFDVTTETIAATDYALMPRGKTKQNTYLWLQFRTPNGRRWGGYAVTITGNWGMATVPAVVEQACLIAVADGYRNPEGQASRGVGDLTYSEVAEPADTPARSLPPDARALLQPYRRISYG